MISEARGYKEMAEEYANDVKAEKADLDTLGEAILALRRMVSDAGKDR